MSFYEYNCDDRMYLKSTLMPDSEISYGFTSALGGVSHGKISGLNLGFRVHDDETSVRENYRLLSNDLGIDLNRTVLAKQTHTDNIRIVTEADCGKGIFPQSRLSFFLLTVFRFCFLTQKTALLPLYIQVGAVQSKKSRHDAWIL